MSTSSHDSCTTSSEPQPSSGEQTASRSVLGSSHGRAKLIGNILKIETDRVTHTYRTYRVKGRVPTVQWEARLIRLEKDGSDSNPIYDIQWRDGRWTCDCQDFVARKADLGLDCKHIGAALATKLIERNPDANSLR